MTLIPQLTEAEDSTMMKSNEAMMSQKRVLSLEGQLQGTEEELHTLRQKYEELSAEKGGGDEMVSALHTTNLKLSAQIEQLDISQHKFAQTIQKLDEELATAHGKVAELENQVITFEHTSAERQADNEKVITSLKEEHKIQFDDQATEVSRLQKELTQVTAEQMARQAEQEAAVVRATELQLQNDKITEENVVFMQKYHDQEQQHKLNERKNMKNIKELKLEISRMKREVTSLNEKLEQAEAVGADRHGLHQPLKSTNDDNCPEKLSSDDLGNVQADLNAEHGSLEDVNARLAIQLSEALMELERKETMLQEYLCNQPTGRQTTMEMDMLKEEQEIKRNSSFGRLFGSKEMVDIEVHSQLKAVLEETLLENIRLKSDLETMGEEVEKYRVCTGGT